MVSCRWCKNVSFFCFCRVKKETFRLTTCRSHKMILIANEKWSSHCTLTPKIIECEQKWWLEKFCDKTLSWKNIAEERDEEDQEETKKKLKNPVANYSAAFHLPHHFPLHCFSFGTFFFLLNLSLFFASPFQIYTRPKNAWQFSTGKMCFIVFCYSSPMAKQQQKEEKALCVNFHSATVHFHRSRHIFSLVDFYSCYCGAFAHTLTCLLTPKCFDIRRHFVC